MFELTTLASLFNNRLFRIPDYQRGYAWGGNEIEDFWRDIISLREGKNHYTGVLTLEKVSDDISTKWSEDKWLINGRGCTPYYIVDGQQRITTSIILIKSIIDVTHDKYQSNDLNYLTIEEIMETYLYKRNEKSNLQSCVFSYEKGNPSYHYFMAKILGIPDILDINIENTKYTKNLEHAYDYFYNKLSIMDFDDIQKVFKIVSQRMLYNIYFIDDDLDIFVTFETMNNRGKPLSILELLENRLIYLSTMFIDDTGQAEELRRQINNGWKDIFHYLGKNKTKQLNDDEFLAYHAKIFFIKKDKMYSEDKKMSRIRTTYYYSRYLLNEYFTIENIISKKITIPDIVEYITSLKNSVSSWYVLNNENEYTGNERTRRVLTSINDISRIYRRRIRLGSYGERVNEELSLTLLALISSNYSDGKFRRILKLINTYEFLTLFIVLEEEYSKIKPSGIEYVVNYSEYIFELINGKPEALEGKLEECINYLQNSKNLKTTIDYYAKSGFYKTNFPIKYFFIQYERHLSYKSKTGIEKLDYEGVLSEEWYSKNNIEHIFPQRGRHEYWTSQLIDKTAEERKLLRNSLGNLVIINNDKNNKLANLPFTEKNLRDLLQGIIQRVNWSSMMNGV